MAVTCSRQFLQLKAVSGCKCRERGGGVKWYYTSNLNLHMPYFWSAQLGNSAAALWAQEWFFFFFLLYRVFCCLSVPCTSLALKDVEYLWLPCAAMMWLQGSFQLSGRNERLGSLRAVAKKASKPILSCSTEAHTALIGYWFQFHYGESTFLATNMGSHMLSCKYENCKALLRAALSQSIQKAEDPNFPL